MYKKFLKDESGATATEYAVIVALVISGIYFAMEGSNRRLVYVWAIVAGAVTLTLFIRLINKLLERSNTKKIEKHEENITSAKREDLASPEVSATKQILEALHRQAVKQKQEAAAFWLRSRFMPRSEMKDDTSDEELRDWTHVTKEFHAENAVIYRQLSQRLKQIVIFEELLDSGTSFTKSELEGHQKLQDVVSESERAHSNSHNRIMGCLRRLDPIKKKLKTLEKGENRSCYTEELLAHERDLNAARAKRRELKRSLKADKLVIYQFEADLLDTYVDPGKIEEAALSVEVLIKEYDEGFVQERRNWECSDFKQALIERYHQP